MKIIKTLFFCIILILSCKSLKWDNYDLEVNYKNIELDQVFYAVLNSEFKESGKSIAILDRSFGESSIKFKDYEMSPVNSEKIIFWNNNIFPYANYIDGSQISELKNKDEKKYQKLIREHGQNGWLELMIPIFSLNKKFAIIEVNFYKGTGFNAPSYYLLERRNNMYEIIKLGLIKNLTKNSILSKAVE